MEEEDKKEREGMEKVPYTTTVCSEVFQYVLKERKQRQDEKNGECSTYHRSSP